MTEQGPLRRSLPSLVSLRIPAHVGVLVGLSTGAYALSLAAMVGLQSTSEAAIAAQRAPAIAAIEALNRRATGLDTQLAAARAGYESAAAAYAATGAGFQEMEARLDELAAAVDKINGTVSSLPTSIRLPALARSMTSAPAPVVHAITTASGG